MTNEVVVVVAGGQAPSEMAVREVPPDAHVIAADGGLDHARALGLEVATVIGDLDSVGDTALREAKAAGTRVERHPADKDATDLELALDAALALRPARILVLAGDGGRLDHLLGTLLLLASPRYEGAQIDAEIGPARAHVIRGARVVAGHPEELVSLLALHGAAIGVSTQGLLYPLSQERLEPGSTRGVSNVFVAETALVRVEAGVVLAVRPGLDGTETE